MAMKKFIAGAVAASAVAAILLNARKSAYECVKPPDQWLEPPKHSPGAKLGLLLLEVLVVALVALLIERLGSPLQSPPLTPPVRGRT